MNGIKLTQFSHGAGCGCKISPKVLGDILHNTTIGALNDSRLLVGNESLDDAAVYDLGDGTAIISTTDFFMPIVDDPFTFGQIAAVNAISDIYAMGGVPLLAIAVLGWPVNKIPADVASLVVDGGKRACMDAGIVLAGGHSIDSPEPIFGLAVTGRVATDRIKRNSTATPGCRLYLTKPLGVGILTTAQKQGRLKEEHSATAVRSMLTLNSLGPLLAGIKGVKAMTDVTGFGLLGHLTEICRGSGLSAIIDYNAIPVLPEAAEYIEMKCIPGGTNRNWDSYGDGVLLKDERARAILCDPQTSGGLLIAVEDDEADEVEAVLTKNNISSRSFGYLTERQDFIIQVD